ncbi:MAG TPA: efflux RND transporter periplasmic adaptor subunit [Gemmatimonadaceae bacterium]|nr:efflux RND transporter periplasmic adaptor subunit [Gemmatimonadaceae bacterium]
MNRKTILVLAAFTAVACSKKQDKALTIPVEPVKRETIVVDAEATGVVEPINVIEVKAKSSGQIVAMPVETGTYLKPGDLLVQLDTRDTRNAYAQAKADLDASIIKQRVSKTARDRAAQLFKERIITSAENEAAEVDYANSQATVLRNRAALDLRQQGLDEATVRAPVAGTVIEKDVALGQVIASGTGSFGGGTTILKMADLTKVRVRALVNETDIGKVRAGLPASVTVDAYPDRPFQGVVEKIEPQATIQQSVTMFPVLISIDNRGGLLMPGMNGEVSIETDHRENVLAVSNDAVRSPNEVQSVATLLGLNPDSVRAQLASMGGGNGRGQFGRGGNGGGNGAANGAAGQTASTTGSTASPATTGGQGGGQGGFNLPEVTDAQCAKVTATLAKHPEVQKQLADLRTRMQSGELDRQGMQAESQKIYSAISLDPMVARACNFKARQAQGGGGFAGGGQGGNRAGGAAAPGASAAPAVADPTGAFMGSANAGQARARRGLVFTVKGGKYTAKIVRLGASNFDVSEVLSGLNEGDSVAILNVAVLQAQNQADMNNIRNRAGVPGMQRQQPAGGAGGAGGAARPGGGGGAPRGGN